ncbi:hypothetical protein Bca4012_093714 [Brassica carinata]
MESLSSELHKHISWSCIPQCHIGDTLPTLKTPTAGSVEQRVVPLPHLPSMERVYDPQGQVVKLESEEEVVGEKGDKSWLRVSLASRKLRESISARPVVLEKIWEQGFMALAAVGATNIGSIEISIKPELRTHEPKKKLFPAAFLIVWKKALAHLKKETNPQFVMLLCKGVLAQRNRTNPKQQHVDSHEVAAASDVHGFPEAEQPDLNGGGASSGLQIGKED